VFPYTESIILSFFTALLLTYISIPAIIKVAEVKHLYDEPGGRKLHKSRIPTLGGLAIFVGYIFSMTFFTSFAVCNHLQFVVAAMIVVVFVGLQDDIIGLSPFKKSIGQVIAAVIIVVWGDLRITHMFGIFGVGNVPEIFSIIFSILAIVLIINSFNLIDGINGLAASLAIIAACTFGIYFFTVEKNSQHAILSFILAGSLVAFLRFNLSPSKIFLGDTGSMLIGLIIAVLCIEFIQLNTPLPMIPVKLKSAPMIAMAIVFVPLYDLVRVFTIRIFQKKSPFYPDQNHLHHLLLKLGYSHTWATVILSMLAILLIILAFTLNFLGNYLLGILLLGICIGFNYYLNHQIKLKGTVNINGKE